MFLFRRVFSTFKAASPEKMASATAKVQSLIDENAVIVFSKTTCPYCTRTKSILRGAKAKFEVFEVNQEPDGDDIYAALKKLTGQKTVPQIFIGRKLIGGNSDLEAIKDDKLSALLAEAGAL